ncbi:MAG: AMP-binding protein [Pseudomonadales bacterium]|nr:AMP-binding protein [Pseudomonadales bacterium]
MNTLIELLEQQQHEFADKPVFCFLDRRLQPQQSISFHALFQQAVALAASLQDRLPAREPVLLVLPHGYAFIHCFLACILADVIPACRPLPRKGEWPVLDELLKKLEFRYVITLARFGKTLEQNLSSTDAVQVLFYEQLYPANAQASCEQQATQTKSTQPWQRPTPQANAIAFLQFSSGTTGLPKGIQISHRNILANSASIRTAMGLTPRDITLSWLPFHHDMGLIGHIIQSLFTGMSTYFMAPAHFIARPLDWLSAMSTFAVSVSGAPNFGLQRCLQALAQTRPAVGSIDLSCLRLLYSGSELINASTTAALLSALQPYGLKPESFFACYGLAEATLFVCGHQGLRTHVQDRQAGTSVCLGTEVASAGVRIMHEHSLRECAEGDIGEICISNDSVAGYYPAPPSSARPDLLRTGDLGFIYRSALYFSGRKPGRLKLHGRLLQAEPLECLLLNPHARPDIQRLLLLQPEPRTETGTEALAGNDSSQLILVAELCRNPQQQAADLIASLGTDTWRLIGCSPQQIILLPANSLPLTTSGKPIRSRCLALHETGAWQQYCHRQAPGFISSNDDNTDKDRLEDYSSGKEGRT